MTSFFITAGPTAATDPAFSETTHKWLRFKQAGSSLTLTSPFASANVIGNKGSHDSFFETGDGNRIDCTGTWLQ